METLLEMSTVIHSSIEMNLIIPGEHVQDAEGVRQAQEEHGEGEGGRGGGASQEEEQGDEAVQAQVLIRDGMIWVNGEL